MAETLTMLAMFILPGMVGGLVRGLVGIRKHILKNKEVFDISKFLFTIIIASVVGGVAAIMSGGDWRISLLAGYAGSDLIESIYKTRLLGLFKVF